MSLAAFPASMPPPVMSSFEVVSRAAQTPENDQSAKQSRARNLDKIKTYSVEYDMSDAQLDEFETWVLDLRERPFAIVLPGRGGLLIRRAKLLDAPAVKAIPAIGWRVSMSLEVTL